MPGAIIPDDWDGVTFECQRIEWPASPKWLAILLGQVSEPSQAAYWDADTGSVDDAIEAVNDAFDLTIPDIYTKECDDVIPAVPVSSFAVIQTIPQVIPSTVWTKILWSSFAYQTNSPNFNIANSLHEPMAGTEKPGIWHYTAHLNFTTSIPAWLKIEEQPSGKLLAVVYAPNTVNLHVSADINVDDVDAEITVSLLAIGGTTLVAGLGWSTWYGHWLGPVA